MAIMFFLLLECHMWWTFSKFGQPFSDVVICKINKIANGGMLLIL